MSDEGRPLKRTHLDTDPNPHSSSPSFQRHHEFWLPDGNIILVANNTTAFRIYRSLIACQSTIFDDMFAASTLNHDELFDGCPVVHLADSPQDLAHLLSVLLPKSRRLYHGTTPRTFDELSAVVRLAHKYHIQDVEDQALASLRTCLFSTDFDDWFKPPTLACLSCTDTAAAIGIVNIARLTDTPALLPGALYSCAHLGGRVLDGWTRDDGTVEHLPAEDLRRCLDASCVLGPETTLLPTRVFSSDIYVQDCRTQERCKRARKSVLIGVLSSEVTAAGRKALGGWEAVINLMVKGKEGNEKRVCKACGEALLERDRRERWLLWKRLPEIFGVTVDGWGLDPETGQE